MKMLRGVLVLRTVAAADVAALQAHAQVYPGIVGLEAFFATVGARLHVADLVQVRAFCRHHAPYLNSQ
jgi:hypothetical protein